jgi:hypothetical protein
MYFHLSRGQPVFPSRVSYRLFELRVTLSSCLRIASLTDLAGLGLRTEAFGQMSYAEREQACPRTREIAEAAYFNGRDGRIVPSARSERPDILVFCDPTGPGAVNVVRDHGLVDWSPRKTASLGY